MWKKVLEQLESMWAGYINKVRALLQSGKHYGQTRVKTNKFTVLLNSQSNIQFY